MYETGTIDSHFSSLPPHTPSLVSIFFFFTLFFSTFSFTFFGCSFFELSFFSLSAISRSHIRLRQFQKESERGRRAAALYGRISSPSQTGKRLADVEIGFTV